jgi:RNA polymerase sigma-70 factor, ECF subfamily
MDNDHATALIARSRGGDERAFEELVVGYQGYSYALAFRFLGNPEEAREVVQDVFLKIWTSLRAFDPARTFKVWLSRIIVNACLDRIRRLNRRRAVPLDEDFMRNCPATDSENGPDSELARKELFDRALEIADRLPPKQRAVFILRDLEDLDMDEIAAVLSVSPAAVKSNLCHARRTVRGGLLEMEKKGRIRHDL